MSEIIHCKECKHWADKKYEWNGCRPCDAKTDLFFAGGGDNNDGLYTSPNFYCAAAQHGVQPTGAQAHIQSRLTGEKNE